MFVRIPLTAAAHVLAQCRFTFGLRRIVRRFGREPFGIVPNPVAFSLSGCAGEGI